MLPYTVNSPRYKRKPSKGSRNSRAWVAGIVSAVLLLAGGYWYSRSHTSYVQSLVSAISEHELKYTHLTSENEAKDTEIRRLNNALEAAKVDRAQVQEEYDWRDKRIDKAEMSERKIQVQLETLTKEQAGTIDQLKEAQDQVSLSQQEITEAKMAVAECRRQQNSTDLILAKQAAGSLNSAADYSSGGNLTAGIAAAVNKTVSTVSEAAVNNPIVQLGKTADDDDETHPGLEKPLGKQEEL